jgi:hypothetical protein
MHLLYHIARKTHKQGKINNPGIMPDPEKALPAEKNRIFFKKPLTLFLFFVNSY